MRWKTSFLLQFPISLGACMRVVLFGSLLLFLCIPPTLSTSCSGRKEAGEDSQCTANEDPVQELTPVCEDAFAVTSDRVVVVADVHGDGDRLMTALDLAGLVRDKRWVGGSSVFVQTGDILDRGPDSFEILSFLKDLKLQARQSGGCVIQLLGNHEILNLAGDFSYADPAETVNFGGSQGRREKLASGHWLGDYLRELPLIARVVQKSMDGSNFTIVMSHAGVGPWIAEQHTIQEVNELVQGAFRGASEREIRHLAYTSKLLLGQGPVWTRVFADRNEDRVCEALDRSLRAMESDRMVVGHTVQMTGRPTVRCQGRLVLADTGMSRAYGGGYSLVQFDPLPESPITLF